MHLSAVQFTSDIPAECERTRRSEQVRNGDMKMILDSNAASRLTIISNTISVGFATNSDVQDSALIGSFSFNYGCTRHLKVEQVKCK
jgi:hypothetical protein